MSRGLLGGQSSAVIYQVRPGTEIPRGAHAGNMRPILSPEVRSLSAVEKPAASAGRSLCCIDPRLERVKDFLIHWSG